MKEIYLDHAAATSLDRKVLKEIEKNYKLFGNPSSLHREGEGAKRVLEESRKKVARLLHAKPEEIIFMSSGTESVNLAVFGVARANRKKGKHIITSSIEHLSVLNSFRQLEKEGFIATYVGVDKNGVVNPRDIEKNLKKETILVSIMQANNEIGVIQPIREISCLISNFRKKNGRSYPYFHTDACQAAGYLNIRPHDLGVDLLSINSSKIYGPKGSGCLFVRRGVPIEPITFGGSQEKGLRAGTENILAISGFAKAFEIAEKEKEKNFKRETILRDYCIERILREVPDSRLNGHPKKRLPNNINISFKEIDGEMLVLYLSEKGIMLSTGSACTTSEVGHSHVIKALGGDSGWGNIRVTLGKDTTKKEIDYFLKTLQSAVKRLRNL